MSAEYQFLERETNARPIRPQCLDGGGPAPCIDDLCHGTDRTLCGLYRYDDFCEHGFIPETCQDCGDDTLYGGWQDE